MDNNCSSVIRVLAVSLLFEGKLFCPGMQYPAKPLSKYEGKIKIFLDMVGLENLQPADFFFKTHTGYTLIKQCLSPFIKRYKQQ